MHAEIGEYGGSVCSKEHMCLLCCACVTCTVFLHERIVLVHDGLRAWDTGKMQLAFTC
jgi:hypothetical protein